MPLFSALHAAAVDATAQSPANQPKTAKLEVDQQGVFHLDLLVGWILALTTNEHTPR